MSWRREGHSCDVQRRQGRIRDMPPCREGHRCDAERPERHPRGIGSAGFVRHVARGAFGTLTVTRGAFATSPPSRGAPLRHSRWPARRAVRQPISAMAANPNSRYRAESAMTGAPRLTSTASEYHERDPPGAELGAQPRGRTGRTRPEPTPCLRGPRLTDRMRRTTLNAPKASFSARPPAGDPSLAEIG